MVKVNIQKELVSVIMATFNTGKKLADSIDSILNQTYSNLELVITDDCSDDKVTLDILRRYIQEDERVDVLYLESNRGPGYARDKSIERARGRYIAFCDSDDRWFAGKLEQQIRFMQARYCALSYTSYVMCDEAGCETGITIAPDCITFSQLKRDNKIGSSTVVYDTKLLGRKYFMAHIRKRQDWGMFLTIMRDYGKPAYGIREPLAYYLKSRHSISHKKFGLVKYNIQIYREVLGYSKLKAVCYFLFIFMPSYIAKIVKRHFDSIAYMHKNEK